jgi:ergothioneine biosynthesis protein EgtB
MGVVLSVQVWPVQPLLQMDGKFGLDRLAVDVSVTFRHEGPTTSMENASLSMNAPQARQGQPLSGIYLSIRQHSEQICGPLAVEDYALQAMASTSPAKWHLAHTTWFFETFILRPYSPGYVVFHPRFEYLFNSYYNAVGRQFPRNQRGLLSRPTVDEIYQYRRHVDEAVYQLLDTMPSRSAGEVMARLELGCHHEQQHQELLHTDLKYCLFQNPMHPAYSDKPLPLSGPLQPINWQTFDGQLQQIGHDIENGFCFDNELPRHPQYVAGFRIADRLASNGEFLEFMAEGGYERPELWLADGWAALTASASVSEQPPAPLYWVEQDGQWLEYTLYGLTKLDPNRPACHLSAYEADAFARWMGARLPTEFEWEVSATAHDKISVDHSLSDDAPLHPQVGVTGSLWQWTSSAYSAYPGFKAAAGALGEYNGKFMANQLVLRGGSVATSPGHYRHSYRNFFYPQDQWQFTGVRLAQDL